MFVQAPYSLKENLASLHVVEPTVMAGGTQAGEDYPASLFELPPATPTETPAVTAASTARPWLAGCPPQSAGRPRSAAEAPGLYCHIVMAPTSINASSHSLDRQAGQIRAKVRHLPCVQTEALSEVTATSHSRDRQAGLIRAKVGHLPALVRQRTPRAKGRNKAARPHLRADRRYAIPNLEMGPRKSQTGRERPDLEPKRPRAPTTGPDRR